jgi:outer membrane lipoprotein
MHAAHPSTFRLLPVFAAAAVLAACAPAPIYKTGASAVVATPTQVATAPGNFAGSQVIWGGTVIGVSNQQARTEIRILAYPLDRSQRPRLKKNAEGRFTAVIPGFLDPMNYPPGSPVTVAGKLDGTTVGNVGQATYTYPLVNVASGSLHRWTPGEMSQGHPNISFGIGVGTWIH